MIPYIALTLDVGDVLLFVNNTVIYIYIYIYIIIIIIMRSSQIKTLYCFIHYLNYC